MLRPFTIFIVLLAIATAAPAQDTAKFLGAWKAAEPFLGFEQSLEITQDGDKWSIAYSYRSGSGATGSAVGENVVVKDGALQYVHKFVKFPHSTWKDKDDVQALKIAGDRLELINVTLGKSVRFYVRVGEPKAIAKIEPKPDPKIESKKEPAAEAPKKDMPENKFVGAWKGSLTGYDEIWTIKDIGGRWSVNGKVSYKGTEVGSFIGADVKMSDGTLTFTRRWIKNPKSGLFLDELVITVTDEGNNLSYMWNSDEKKGVHALEKVGEGPAEGGKSAAAALEKFAGIWEADIATGFHVVMQIVVKNNKVEVAATYKNKKGLVAGAFIGVDTNYKDGVVTFTQKFAPKPVSSWGDNKFHTLDLLDDKTMKFSWKNGGTEKFTKVVR